ncbi:MAG: thioredoxin peroxidase [Candidatus Schekmanbacteria bacterium RIFCSPHIGHO2_02_FULL_38_11]|uniref:Thioredoxin peroxidase n=1 Tax=Candidatus Schekmanbacteria bacterium RIFCSPLOWO2_12_FULL_38_15 TaxID=1817883 RepID=A0A1F7SI16_9BACT|nr:MAG: thioredoxin peroxidase [Candidatus Schekmanbacteria bacterium RIFCSPLOWO2_02_FULL_38_14]OGL52878.1 MAG: thioredoxin peroxidase [Candidatus Schekmanbacteria bacterium RIFCSPLOWO2_12_FULL_38_15]OGL55359.1 MAG: thioredoxin peroxidase [Candidatus Schekmanbacteria bacterium RIFCSPHIGHO2_02_FULL_38_11]
MSVQVGQKAPNFEVEGVLEDQFISESLSKYRGKWVVLFFYPLDFTFICPTEITEFSKRNDEFKELKSQVLGMSIDSKFSHKAWLKELGQLKYPLLSDITKDVSRNYGVLLEDKGIALRGTFIIDPEGTLKYQLVHDLGIGRSVEEVLRVLKALQTGELCPVEWKPGKKTLGKA